MGVLYQVLGTTLICFLCMSMGLMFAWPSATLTLFQSANTTLHRPMKETELALFGSLSSIGALISTPLCGFLLDRVGRKYTCMLMSLTHVIAWSMVAASNRVEVILTAIFISGIGGAVFLAVPVYVSEICQESIRGAMTSGSMISYGLGLLLSYLLGGLLQYKTMIFVNLTMSVLGVVSLSFLKESPTFYMMKGFDEDAAKSIAFYRNTSSKSKEVSQEMDSLRRAFNPDLDNGEEPIAEEEKLKPPPQTKVAEKLSLWQFIKKSKSTRRAIIICLTLITLSTFQGIVVIQVYAEPLFIEAVPNISATICSVVMAVVIVVVGFIAAYFTELLGRKPLMVYSSIATGLCCIVLGTQLHLHWAPHWTTAIFIYLFCTAYTFGAGTVPFVIVAEIFLPEVKSFMSMLVIEWAWLCNFIILFIFNPLVSAIGLGPIFYIFAIVCFLSAVVSIIYQPETKGMPVDAIQMLFLKKSNRKKSFIE